MLDIKFISILKKKELSRDFNDITCHSLDMWVMGACTQQEGEASQAKGAFLMLSGKFEVLTEMI